MYSNKLTQWFGLIKFEMHILRQNVIYLFNPNKSGIEIERPTFVQNNYTP